MQQTEEEVLTPEGYDTLQAELSLLEGKRRGEIATRLRQALEQAGDLGDNLEYLEASREQEALEQRIAVLEGRLASARVVAPAPSRSTRVALGCRLELEDLDTGAHSSFRLVSSPEANPAEGRLSVESPVGRSVFGHRAGDTVDVATPHGLRHLRIVAAANQRP